MTMAMAMVVVVVVNSSSSWQRQTGPVGPPARLTSTSNVEGGSGTEEGAQGP